MKKGQENSVSKEELNRRKRVNLYKKIIIAICIILVFSSAFLNLVLIFKVISLEKQVSNISQANQNENILNDEIITSVQG
ncbi:MAG: hypothetical protein U0L23_04315 [Lachnospiraceae bacterium]|nr:hypothetical protein [Lachnospiraceae bacterium]MEE1341918.1 hypothetical protein [Lachnospiraceae bacterium]